MHDVLLAAADGVQQAIRDAGLHVGDLLGPQLAPPDPGSGQAPPGFEKIELLLKWVAWIVFAMCVMGILIVSGRMAIMHQRGQGGEHAAGLGWVMGACVLAGVASSLVGLLI